MEKVYLVTDEELKNAQFLRDTRVFASKLPVSRRAFVDFLVNGVRDSDSEVIDADGNPVEIDFEELERANIDLWVRDWATFPAAQAACRVRAESRERVRLVATMLRMIFPKESSVWGRDA